MLKVNSVGIILHSMGIFVKAKKIDRPSVNNDLEEETVTPEKNLELLDKW